MLCLGACRDGRKGRTWGLPGALETEQNLSTTTSTRIQQDKLGQEQTHPTIPVSQQVALPGAEETILMRQVSEDGSVENILIQYFNL